MIAKYHGDVNLWIKRGIFHYIKTMKDAPNDMWYLDYQLELFHQRVHDVACTKLEFHVTIKG